MATEGDLRRNLLDQRTSQSFLNAELGPEVGEIEVIRVFVTRVAINDDLIERTLIELEDRLVFLMNNSSDQTLLAQ